MSRGNRFQEMRAFDVGVITPNENCWPRQIDERLGASVPRRLWTIGTNEILANRKIGLFGSVDCPADVVTSARKNIQKFTGSGATFISGFHSSVEKECLEILIETKQMIVVSVARSLERMRVPAEWQESLENGRLLILSRFEKTRRADKDTARRRNELVAAMSDEVLIIHASDGGAISQVADLVRLWGIPFEKLDSEIS
jgi:predicted Rossmann fold nucleotide-binding protein DprA/Smf involved in DNA uptake